MHASAAKLLPKWEIFCRVVDNYGDAGVCWRLARTLAARYGVEARVWVDDWPTLARLCPEAVRDGSRTAGVELRHWKTPFPEAEVADVVIEAFACELPAAHVRAMAARKPPPVWINLEYLSAEDWVRTCHGLASPQPEAPFAKYFFFPGFTEGTGGLIREPGLLARRNREQGRARAEWLRERGLRPPREDALLVSLFSYEQPMLSALLQRWRTSERPLLLLTPEGRALDAVGAALGVKLRAGDQLERDALRVAALPFTNQDGYDELLWRCDLNLVRGEDSFVRAQWAARPLVWHIYPQEDGAHHVKLDAFLKLYSAGLGLAAAGALAGFWRAWNGRGDPSAAWPAFVHALPELESHAGNWCTNLCKRPDLSAALWRFCRHIAGETG
ncbi:MAG: elongation factor P maturation arginine rhamnosyltransferase EarP [Azoarcus sp.]|nr:elongation factor P maturation arginine rhamnosyltransferase EarP [Azoarcus sp.]